MWLYLATPVVVYFGVQIYNQRETLAPPVEQAIVNLMGDAQSRLSTAIAPTATPTENPTNRLALAESDWREGRIESAIQNYETIIGALPNDLQAHYRLTFGLVMEGRFGDAETAAEDTVTANPFAADAWAVRALALTRTQRYGEAVASAQRALDIDPNNVRALAFMAEAYYFLEAFDLARSTAERALDLDPQSFEALRIRGLLYQNVDFDFPTAADYLSDAYTIAPNLPILAINYARILYFGEQRLDEAIAVLNDVIELNPNNALALYELGNYYFRGQGNASQAAEMLRRCVDTNPESIDCNALLGRVLFGLNDIPGSVQALQVAIELGSTDPYHLFWLGRSLRAGGNCVGAVPLFEEAVVQASRTGVADVQSAAGELLAECRLAFGVGTPTPSPEFTAQETAEATADATIEATPEATPGQ